MPVHNLLINLKRKARQRVQYGTTVTTADQTTVKQGNPSLIALGGNKRPLA